MAWIVILLLLPGAAMILFIVLQFLYRGKKEIAQLNPTQKEENRPKS
jgi:hypothetical protein